MIKSAGWMFTLLGAMHMLLTIALTAGTHATAWVRGELWTPEGTIAAMSPAMGAFWMTLGSFGIPLLVVGLTVLWLHRNGITPPAFIAWTIGAWSVAGGLIFEPAPWIVVTVAAALLLAGTRKAARPKPRPAD